MLLPAGPGDAIALTPLGQHAGVDAVSEATIQALVHAHPGCMPIAEIDPVFVGPVPICMELNTPAGSGWLNVYRDLKRNQVGVYLSSTRDSAGDYAMQTIYGDLPSVRAELGGTVQAIPTKDGRPRIGDTTSVSSLADPAGRDVAFKWLANRVNDFVNVMRPRVMSAVADYQARTE